jgi:hypothetical protein
VEAIPYQKRARRYSTSLFSTFCTAIRRSRGGRLVPGAFRVSALAAMTAKDGTAGVLFTAGAAIRVRSIDGAAARRVAARPPSGYLGLSHAATTDRRLEKRTVAAVGQLIAAAHDKLKPVTFATQVAADIHAVIVRDDIQIARAQLVSPGAVGVEEVLILGRDSLHDPFRARNGPRAAGGDSAIVLADRAGRET